MNSSMMSRSRPAQRDRYKRRITSIVRWTVIYIVVAALAMLFVLPFIWLVSGSLKTDRQMFTLPPIWIPNPLTWQNYPDSLVFIPYFRYVGNTLIICFGTVIGSLFSCTLAAYGFSRIRWPGRDVVFMIVIATMMLPYAVVMVPLFIVFRQLGWIGTYLPLIVPSFFGSAFFIFLLRQFFLSIPQELSDAARIDGANELQILIRVILPLARPALAMVALFQFMYTWSDYLGPLIYISKQDMYTIALGLTLFLDQHAQEWALLMAASTMALVPIIVLFFFTQRMFIEGISMTGIKG